MRGAEVVVAEEETVEPSLLADPRDVHPLVPGELAGAVRHQRQLHWMTSRSRGAGIRHMTVKPEPTVHSSPFASLAIVPVSGRNTGGALSVIEFLMPRGTISGPHYHVHHSRTS